MKISVQTKVTEMFWTITPQNEKEKELLNETTQVEFNNEITSGTTIKVFEVFREMREGSLVIITRNDPWLQPGCVSG